MMKTAFCGSGFLPDKINSYTQMTYLEKKTEGVCWNRPFGDELIKDETPFFRTKPTVAAIFVALETVENSRRSPSAH